MQTFDKTSILYWRLLSYVSTYKFILFAGIFATMLYATVDAASTYALKPLLDDGFIKRSELLIRWVPLIVLLAFVFRGGVSFISNYCMTYVARTVVMTLRQQMFRHMLRLPAKYFDHNSSGKLLSKLLYDIEQVAVISTDALTNLVQAGCFAIGLFVVMLLISWKLTLAYLLLVPVIALIVKITNKRIRRVSHNVQNSMGEVTNIAEESIEGYREVRVYGGQNYESGKFNKATCYNRDGDIKVTVTKSLNVSGVQIVAAMGISVIIFLAINPQYTTQMSAGAFVSMMAAMLSLLKPLKVLSNVSSIIQRGLAGAQSIFDFLDLPTENDHGKTTITKAKGEIQYHNVNFAYNKDELVVKNINFRIEPGKTIALVGRSGSGKSTIASLLARFYDIKQGQITIDGIDIQDLPLDNLRQQIALVSQSVVLFNDTIANNIAYGCDETVTEEDIQQAATAAYASEFINQLPEGLNTIVGENGVLLSGGQRQRIAIARAILKDAPILILDEATSALDTESERSIQKALETVMQNRTTLVIAHRLSTIENADWIMVLECGQIVEAGSHSELLVNDGYYRKLHSMQFSESLLQGRPQTLEPSYI